MDDVRRVMDRVEACFNSRQLDEMDDFVAESMVNHAAAPQGRDGWKQVWRSILTCFPDAVTETHSILVDGDTAAVHTSIVGTHDASLMPLLEGIEPSHRRVRWEFIHLFKVVDGMITEHRAVRDDLGLLRQIQGAPEKPSDAIATIESFMAAFIEAWPTGDATGLARFFSDDAVYQNGPLPPVHGRDAIVASFAGQMALGGEVSVDIRYMLADGPIVMNERVDHVTVGGRSIPLRMMGTFEVHDGVITAWRDYFDPGEFSSQLPTG